MNASKVNVRVSNNQGGFGAIGILLLVMTVVVVLGAGWLVLQRNNDNESSDTPAEHAATTKSYTDSAKLYSLTYPSTWVVKEDSDCCEGEAKDYTKVSRGVTLVPTDKASINGYGLSIQADATDALAKSVEQNWADNKHTPELKTINNYSAKYVKITFTGDAENYIDHNYLITHESKSVFVSFREKYYHQYPKEDWSASQDISVFRSIVNSITFK